MKIHSLCNTINLVKHYVVGLGLPNSHACAAHQHIFINQTTERHLPDPTSHRQVTVKSYNNVINKNTRQF